MKKNDKIESASPIFSRLCPARITRWSMKTLTLVPAIMLLTTGLVCVTRLRGANHCGERWRPGGETGCSDLPGLIIQGLTGRCSITEKEGHHLTN